MALAREELQRTAVVYARISKDVAGDELGVERQVRLCKELAAAQGLHVGDVLIENDTSAYSKKRRPEFERLMGMLDNREVDAVVVYHSDRLYRRAADLERLVEIVEGSGVSVHSVASGLVDLSTASGRMVARMLGAAAQHESERLSERSKLKTDELASKGSPPSGRPAYGYGPGYVVNEVEAEHLRQMARRVLEGASLLRVARELDAAGIKPRKADRWNSTSIRLALLNPAVVGLRVHRREVAGPGNWTPILDRDTWEKVRAVIADPARKHTRSARKYLLAGLVFTNLGDQMNGRMDRGKGDAPDDYTPENRTRATYATRAYAKQAQSIDAEKLEAHVLRAMFVALKDAHLPDPEEPSTNAEVAEIEKELDELAKLRGDRQISISEWMTAREPLLSALEEARTKAGTVRRRSKKLETLLSKRGAVEKSWDSMDYPTKREVLTAVIERVIVNPATNARHTPIEERVPVEANIVWKI